MFVFRDRREKRERERERERERVKSKGWKQARRGVAAADKARGRQWQEGVGGRRGL